MSRLRCIRVGAALVAAAAVAPWSGAAAQHGRTQPPWPERIREHFTVGARAVTVASTCPDPEDFEFCLAGLDGGQDYFVHYGHRVADRLTPFAGVTYRAMQAPGRRYRMVAAPLGVRYSVGHGLFVHAVVSALEKHRIEFADGENDEASGSGYEVGASYTLPLFNRRGGRYLALTLEASAGRWGLGTEDDVFVIWATGQRFGGDYRHSGLTLGGSLSLVNASTRR